MKILITNNRLSELAGSEIFTYTLAKELKELKQDVSVYAFEEHPKDALIPEKLKALGIKTINSPDDLETYDVIHCHHNTTANYINYRFPKTPKIYVSHGWIFPICEPPIDVKFEKVIAVSEEVKVHLENKGHKDIEVINNPIDTKRFKYREYKSGPISVICIASNHAGKPCQRQGNACENWEVKKPVYAQMECMTKCETKPLHQINMIGGQLKSKIINVGCNGYLDDKANYQSKNNMVWDVENAYAESNLIIGIGRSILGAAAMGIPVLVYDHFGYAGFIKSKEHFIELMRTNFSGRLPYFVCNQFPRLDINLFCYEYQNNLSRLKNISGWVKDFYDSKKIAKKYIKIYESISN